MFDSKQLTTTVFGNKRVVYGTYVNDGGSNGGDVKTGLSTVEYFNLQPKGAASMNSQSVVNETFPLVGGKVTVATSVDEVGEWIAIGI